jgi:hypothetical protein
MCVLCVTIDGKYLLLLSGGCPRKRSNNTNKIMTVKSQEKNLSAGDA